MKEQTQILDYDQTESFTGIVKGTLYTLVHRRAIPHIRLGGRLVRFKRDELEKWLGRHEVPEAKVGTDKKVRKK